MKLRTGDFIVTTLVVLLALGIWVCGASTNEKGTRVTVSRDGKVIYTAPLAEDETIEFPECTVDISGTRVKVKEANCPDKVCEKCGTIQNAGEIIVCVPNRISVEIDGEKSFDAIAN